MAYRHTALLVISIALLPLCMLPAVPASPDFIISIYEEGKVTSYYEDYFIVQSIGNITFQNTQNSSLYNIDLPFQLPGLQIRALNGTGKAFLYQNIIKIYSLDPHENLSISYKISGITPDSFRTDQSILKTAIESRTDLRIYSNLMGSLKKSEVENRTTGINGRLISFDVYNPSSYRFKIDRVTVTKTPDLDPSDTIKEWNFPQDITEMRVGGRSIFPFEVRGVEKEYLLPGERWVVDFYDVNVTEGEVYWLQTDIYLKDIEFRGHGNLTVYTEEDLYKVLANNTNASDNRSSDFIPFLEDRVFLRKFASERQMTFGKNVVIELLVNNLDSSTLRARIIDQVPEGFKITSYGNASVSGSRNLSWENLEVNGRGSKRVSYSLTYVDNDTLGLDYFLPSVLTSGNRIVYSQSVPFIRQYIPEKKLFVQKIVKFLNDEDIEITIQLQNLGQEALNGLVLKEFLATENEFKEVTQAFETKGVWKIASIEQGGVWETKYVTDKTNVLSNLPEVFGVPTNSVMKTIIMSHSMTNSFSMLSRNAIELFGIAVILGAIVFYFLPPNFFRQRRKRDINKIAVMEGEISSLKYQTGTTKETIEEGHKDLLARFSRPGRHPRKQEAEINPPAPQSRQEGHHDKFHDELKKNQELLESMKKSFGGNK